MTTDFVVAVDGESEMYVTGPNVIREVTGEDITSAELGGARVQEQSGNIQAVVPTEEEAFDYVRDLLAHLPTSTFDPAPQVDAPADEELDDSGLDSFMPDDTNAGYDMMDLLVQLGDDEDLVEVQANYAENLICAFGRVDGRAVGFVANNPMYQGGCIDADAGNAHVLQGAHGLVAQLRRLVALRLVEVAALVSRGRRVPRCVRFDHAELDLRAGHELEAHVARGVQLAAQNLARAGEQRIPVRHGDVAEHARCLDARFLVERQRLVCRRVGAKQRVRLGNAGKPLDGRAVDAHPSSKALSSSSDDIIAVFKLPNMSLNQSG